MSTKEIILGILNKNEYCNYMFFEKDMRTKGIYTEAYAFIEKNKDIFEVGKVSRSDRRVERSFSNEEEALMYFMSTAYCTNENINDKRHRKLDDEFFEIDDTNITKKIHFLEKIAPNNIIIDFQNHELRYYDKELDKTLYVKLKKDYFLINAFALILIIESFRKIRKEMIDNGIDVKIVYNYFILDYDLEEGLDVIEKVWL